MIAKFRYDSEISLSYRIFAMIAKITVHSENCLLLFLIQTTAFLVFLLSTLVIVFVLVCFRNFSCFEPYII